MDAFDLYAESNWQMETSHIRLEVRRDLILGRQVERVSRERKPGQAAVFGRVEQTQ
jgi:hypothetical protein